MSVGRRVFLAVLLGQLCSIALIFGWYFYVLRSELDSLTRQGAQEAVLQSIAATEDYFKPAELAVEEGQLLLSDHILGPDNPDPLERFFSGQLRERPLLDGLYIGNPAGEFFYVMRSNEKINDGTRTKVIRNGPLGREVELTWRGPNYAIVKSERDPADTYDPRARAWYRSAVERRGRAWTEPYIFFTSHKPGITLASAITGKDGAVEAVLGVDIEISEILRFLARYSQLGQKSVYISTTEGKVIAHSNASVAVGQVSNIDWPWQVVVTVPRTGLLQAASKSTIILIGAMGLAVLFAFAVGYATSRAIGAPMTQLLSNAQLARHGNIELMEDVNTGLREIDETGKILKELATQQRGR